jgi:CelD/BcsL family acetyltransferase involved in cellulose biosynthesis
VLELAVRPEVAVARDIGPLEQEWDDLALRIRAAPFWRPGWIRAWWGAFGAGELELLIARRGRSGDEDVSGAVALERRRGILRATSNWHTPSFGILAETTADRDALCASLFDRAPRRVSLAFLDSSDDIDCVADHGRRAGYRVLVRTLAESPVIELDVGQIRYEAGLGANLRANLRRNLRRLRAQGNVDVEVEDGRDDLTTRLDECLELEARSWKGASGTAMGSRPETRAFYEGVAKWAMASGLLRLAFLRIDSRPVAFQLALEDGVAYYPLKGGFDPAYARCSPGILLLHATVSRAFEQGLERYELLGGAERYKLEWATRRRTIRLLQAFAPGPAGRLDWAAFAHGRPVAKALRLDTALRRALR